MKKRILVICLALALCLSCFAGCGKSDEQPAETTPVESEPAETTPVETDSADTDDFNEAMNQAIYDRYAEIYAKYDPDEVVMTINGEPVTWSEYFFWMNTTCYQYEAYLNVTDWSAAYGAEGTYQDYVQAAVEAYVTQYWVAMQHIKEQGITLNEEDLEAVEAAKLADLQEVAGGDVEEFEKQKQQMFLTDELYDRLMTTGQYSGRFFDESFGENAEKLPESDVIAFAENNGLMHVKHILVLVDSAATDEEKAEKLALANDLIAQIKAVPAAEQEAKFDELMHEYSEDPGLATYPDGYYFTTGQMYQEFEDASVALGENELSEPVESQSGYHIILRLPVRGEDIYSGEYTMRYAAASELYSNMLTDWYESAEIEYTEMGEGINFNDLFGFVPAAEGDAADGAEAE